MNQKRARLPLHSGGSLWGPERVAAGVSIKELALAARINTGFLSRMENGRMIPTSEEYRRVTEALAKLKMAHTGEAVEG